jgi:hypothetical protein
MRESGDGGHQLLRETRADRTEGAPVLHVIGFERIGVVVGDLYFVDPDPEPGQEGAERGVRLEVRLLERADLPGSIYSAQPITVGLPIWRADLFESVEGPIGSFDRTHHHPRFRGWEPGKRSFDPTMSADPVAYVGARLRDVATLCTEAGVDPDVVPARDAEDLRRAAPEILAIVQRLLAGVRAGELATAPSDEPLASARAGWL